MLLVCMVGQPMAFSMHPFDVDSWAKNGDDAQLESVLGLVAQVSEQDPKELAEDVRSMSGPVRNRMHDYPGTSLLEAWEAEALTHEDFTPTPKHPHNIWIIRTCVVLGVGVGFIWESLVFDQNESHPQRFPDILMIQICWSCWGWGWGLHQSEADGRFKGGRVKAASESLYAIKAINRGTGSLESRFHKGRQLNSKKHMSEDSMEARLRIYISGPKLEKFCTRKVVNGRPEFTGSSLCKRSQAQYRKRYGAKALKKRARSKAADEAEDEASVQCRKDKGVLRKHHPARLAKYLIDKKKQAKEMPKNATSCVDELVMKKLKEESTVVPSEGQLEAKKKAIDALERKRKFIGEMLKPKSKFLDEKNEQELKKQKKVAEESKVHLASLDDNALQKRCLVVEECKMFVARKEDFKKVIQADRKYAQKEGSEKDISADRKDAQKEDSHKVILAGRKDARKEDFEKDIPADRKEDWCKSLTVEHCFKRFLRQNPEKKKLWFSPHTSLMSSPDWQQEVLDQKVLSNDMAFLGAVVFGGYLVDENLVKKSRERGLLEKGLLVEPVWKLEGSMKKALELYLDWSCKEGEKDGILVKECQVLHEAKPDNILVQGVGDPDDPAILVQEAASSCWIWRNERSEIRRKESWVVCIDQDRVEKLMKRKEKMEEEYTKLEENITELQQTCETAVGAKLLHGQKKLKEKQGQLKEKKRVLAKKKGVPITLPKFLEEVVLPQCRLVLED